VGLERGFSIRVRVRGFGKMVGARGQVHGFFYTLKMKKLRAMQ
jgi:hypothetical protein